MAIGWFAGSHLRRYTCGMGERSSWLEETVQPYIYQVIHVQKSARACLRMSRWRISSASGGEGYRNSPLEDIFDQHSLLKR